MSDEREDVEAADWRAGLTHKDWLFDGSPIKGDVMLERYNGLDWSRAWVDLGPSPAGNLGPYWHVPLPSEETVHRLYPKFLAGKWADKWLGVLHQAFREREASPRREALLEAAQVARGRAAHERDAWGSGWNSACESIARAIEALMKEDGNE